LKIRINSEEKIEFSWQRNFSKKEAEVKVELKNIGVIIMNLGIFGENFMIFGQGELLK
jgi:hypothetical protein